MADPLALATRLVEAKVAVPANCAGMETLPEASAATALPRSSPVPPAWRAQSKLPEASYFAKNRSGKPLVPALVRLVAPKAAVPVKLPVTYRLVAPSSAMPLPTSSLVLPPALRAQRKSPELLHLATKMSSDLVVLVRVKLPKVALASK